MINVHAFILRQMYLMFIFSSAYVVYDWKGTFWVLHKELYFLNQQSVSERMCQFLFQVVDISFWAELHIYVCSVSAGLLH